MFTYYEPANIFAVDKLHSTSYLLCANHVRKNDLLPIDMINTDTSDYGDDTPVETEISFPVYGEYEILYVMSKRGTT